MLWVPKLDFDDDIVSLEPSTAIDENPTYHPRPKEHYWYAARQAERRKNIPKDNSRESKQLRMIAKVQDITKTEPLNNPTALGDWQKSEDLEAETIAMMRHLGLGPTVDGPLNEGNTVPTLPIPDELYVMQNGQKRMPIYFGDEYFKLKPDNRILDLPYFEDETANTSSSSLGTDEQSANSSASGKNLSADLKYELLKVNKNASWSTINSNYSYEVPSEGLRDLSFSSSSSRSSNYIQPTRVTPNLGDFIVTTTKRQGKKNNKKNAKVVTPKALNDKKRPNQY